MGAETEGEGAETERQEEEEKSSLDLLLLLLSQIYLCGSPFWVRLLRFCLFVCFFKSNH